MTRWKQFRERRLRKKKALQLLALSGAVRPADVEPRYLGRERIVGGRHRNIEPAWHDTEQETLSIWHKDLFYVWRATLRKAGSGVSPRAAAAR